MQDVNIYIGTSVHGPARKDGEYLYILECIRDGIPVTREGRGTMEKTTENQLALMALAEALDRINCPCEIRIYTTCQHIITSIQNGWAAQWEGNGWRTARGTEVRNAGLWSHILEQMENHLPTFVDGHHPYGDWMKEQLKNGKQH